MGISMFPNNHISHDSDRVTATDMTHDTHVHVRKNEFILYFSLSLHLHHAWEAS